MFNTVAVQGNLVRDLELKEIGEERYVVNGTIAHNRTFVAKGKERETDFLDFTLWNKNAQNAAKFLTKGSQIIVHGAMRTRQYTDKNGNDRVAVYIEGDGFDFCGTKSDSASASHEEAPRRVVPKSQKPVVSETNDEDDDDLPF